MNVHVKTPCGIIATLFGLGTKSAMPGTLGSIAAFGVLLLLGRIPLWLIALVAIVGTWAADRYAKAVGRDDPQEVIVDEVVGYWVSMIGFPMLYSFPALFFFRVVDITKPFPIRNTERLPGGIGIMADDVMGGIVVNALMRLFEWLFFREGMTWIYSRFA